MIPSLRELPCPFGMTEAFYCHHNKINSQHVLNIWGHSTHIIFIHQIVKTILQGRADYYPHVIDEETEA